MLCLAGFKTRWRRDNWQEGDDLRGAANAFALAESSSAPRPRLEIGDAEHGSERPTRAASPDERLVCLVQGGPCGRSEGVRAPTIRAFTPVFDRLWDIPTRASRADRSSASAERSLRPAGTVPAWRPRCPGRCCLGR